jgi:hypothetical protein
LFVAFCLTSFVLLLGFAEAAQLKPGWCLQNHEDRRTFCGRETFHHDLDPETRTSQRLSCTHVAARTKLLRAAYLFIVVLPMVQAASMAYRSQELRFGLLEAKLLDEPEAGGPRHALKQQHTRIELKDSFIVLSCIGA